VHALFWIPSGLGILGILSTINGFMLIVWFSANPKMGAVRPL
jgi:hypothetical protein